MTHPPQTQLPEEPQAFIATTYNLEACCVCNGEANKHEGCHLVCDTHFKADTMEAQGGEDKDRGDD